MKKSFFQSASNGDEDEFDIYDGDTPGSSPDSSKKSRSGKVSILKKKKETNISGFKSPKKGSLPKTEFKKKKSLIFNF